MSWLDKSWLNKHPYAGWLLLLGAAIAGAVLAPFGVGSLIWGDVPHWPILSIGCAIVGVLCLTWIVYVTREEEDYSDF